MTRTFFRPLAALLIAGAATAALAHPSGDSGAHRMGPGAQAMANCPMAADGQAQARGPHAGMDHGEGAARGPGARGPGMGGHGMGPGGGHGSMAQGMGKGHGMGHGMGPGAGMNGRCHGPVAQAAPAAPVAPAAPRN